MLTSSLGSQILTFGDPARLIRIAQEDQDSSAGLQLVCQRCTSESQQSRPAPSRFGHRILAAVENFLFTVNSDLDP